MLVSFKYDSVKELLDFLRGILIVSGTVGTNGAGSPNFGDATLNAFTGVLVGDQVHIAGEASATVFLVGTVTDVNNLILDNNVVAAHTTDAIWRVYRDGKLVAGVALGPFEDSHRMGGGYLFHEVDTFG